MRSRTSEWFEIKISYEKIQEDGSQKKTTEQYVVDALTFTEAENSIIDEMSAYISGDFNVSDIKKAPYHEVFFSDMGNDDKWYKAKLQFITLDEKSGKEKRSNVNYLVQGRELGQAVEYVKEVMGTTMIDYVIANISETKIMDVFEHNGTKKALTERNDVPEYVEQEQKPADAPVE